MATENLSAKYVPNETHVGLLLSAEQRSICEQVAAGDSLDSRRARALLAIDSGSTQADAGRQAGLTRNQVNYCLRLFRQDGLAIFPDAAADVVQPEPDAGPLPDAEPKPDIEPEPLASAGGAEMEVGKAEQKAGEKTARGKTKSKKSKKQGKGGKEKPKSAKTSKEKDKKKSKKKGKRKDAQKGKKKGKKSRKQGKGGKKKSKSAKASKKKSKKKGKR